MKGESYAKRREPTVDPKSMVPVGDPTVERNNQFDMLLVTINAIASSNAPKVYGYQHVHIPNHK